MANLVPSLDCLSTVTETIFCFESSRAIIKLFISVAGLAVELVDGLAVISAGRGAAWPSPLRTKTPVRTAIAKIELISHFKNDGIRFTLDTDLDPKCIRSLWVGLNTAYLIY